jgi:hypothetical protein
MVFVQSGQRRSLLPFPTMRTDLACQSMSPILTDAASLARAPEL